MERFEILKSSTIQYSIFELLKYKLSDFILQEVHQIDISFQNEHILTKEISCKEDISELQRFLEQNQIKFDSNDFYIACLEELNEIRADLKWRNSKEGKIIIKLEQWIESLRMKLHEEFHESKVFVGRSFIDPKELIIGGILKNEVERNKILNFIGLEKPPVSPIYKFEIEA